MLDWLLQGCLESAPTHPASTFYRVSPLCPSRDATLPALAVPMGSVLVWQTFRDGG